MAPRTAPPHSPQRRQWALPPDGPLLLLTHATHPSPAHVSDARGIPRDLSDGTATPRPRTTLSGAEAKGCPLVQPSATSDLRSGSVESISCVGMTDAGCSGRGCQRPQVSLLARHMRGLSRPRMPCLEQEPLRSKEAERTERGSRVVAELYAATAALEKHSRVHACRHLSSRRHPRRSRHWIRRILRTSGS